MPPDRTFTVVPGNIKRGPVILTITYTGTNAPEIGYLFFKNPNRPQAVELNHGKAYVFYPEVSDERTTIALLLDMDPVDLARGKADAGGLFGYVNDRPYVSSSFMSTAIAKAFGTAMSGRGDERQALADAPLALCASIRMLPCGSDFGMLRRVFEPLGYAVSYTAYPADPAFPEWGEARHVDLTLEGAVRLRDLLNHLYVLIPVFDGKKHYWIGADEVDKLFAHSAGWLPAHPEKAYIAGRYLRRNKSLITLAFQRLREMEDDAADPDDAEEENNGAEPVVSEKEEKRLSLNARRLGSVVAALTSRDVASVIDMGCGEGHLLRHLMRERRFERIAGMDVSASALAKAEHALDLNRLPESARKRITLFQGSLTYKDARCEGYDAACVIEVIEHLDPGRLRAFERALFDCAKPRHVVVTTPNVEYNALYDNLPDAEKRHVDHRFEWTREEFRRWASRSAEKYGYSVAFSEIGDSDAALGAPTQMGVFTLCK